MNVRPLTDDDIEFVRAQVLEADLRNPAWKMVARLLATLDRLHSEHAHALFRRDVTTELPLSQVDVIRGLCRQAHDTASSNGFWDDVDKSRARDVAALLALVHTEVSEAVEALRGAGSFVEELADIVIRVFDICGGLGLDLAGAVRRKMELNQSRPRLHGKAF